MTQHDARQFENGTPAEDASDVRPRTVSQRLDTVEQSVAMMGALAKEMLSGFQQHQAIITKLIEMPNNVRDAMTAFAEDQSKANLTMMIKLDQHAALIEELQEVVDDLRGEDDDDYLMDDPMDRVVFDIETQTATPGDFADASNILTYATVGPDGTPVFGTVEADRIDSDLINMIMAAANGEPEAESAPEPATEYVREEGEFVVISLPKVPAPANLDDNEAFDAHLTAVVTELRDEGIIREDVATVLIGGIAGTIEPEKAAAILPQGDPSAGLPEALTTWWEVGEAAQLGVHTGHDMNLAVSQIIAFACLNVSVVNIMTALADALGE